MKILRITIDNKIASFHRRDGHIVCGNSDYKIKFTFDEEWEAYSKKTARFIWGGQYFDVEFTGDSCNVPVITNAYSVQVGVYAGDLKTTTSASIECKRSVLCGREAPNPGSGQHYSNEAKIAAEEAQDAAERAETAAYFTRCEVNPLYIRKAGAYTIHVVRDNTNVVSLQIYQLEAGEVTTTNQERKIEELVWADALLEKEFHLVLEHDVEHGLYINTSQEMAVTVYTSPDAGVEALKAELDQAKLSKIKDTRGFVQLYGVNTSNQQMMYTVASSATAMGGGRIPYYISAGQNAINTAGNNLTLPVGNPKGSYDSANKGYVDGMLYEYERDIPYHSATEPEWQDPPSVVALDRNLDGGVLDIINIVISGYVNSGDGRSCYFNQDITRQVQGVRDKGSFKMAGILSANGNDNLTMYDFKVDVVCEGESFKMKTSRVIVGETFSGQHRSTKANLSNVKVRSILARKINVI